MFNQENGKIQFKKKLSIIYAIIIQWELLVKTFK